MGKWSYYHKQKFSKRMKELWKDKEYKARRLALLRKGRKVVRVVEDKPEGAFKFHMEPISAESAKEFLAQCRRSRHKELYMELDKLDVGEAVKIKLNQKLNLHAYVLPHFRNSGRTVQVRKASGENEWIIVREE